jgi:Cyclophilin-like family
MNTTIRHRAHLGVAVVVLAAAVGGCASEPAADRSSRPRRRRGREPSPPCCRQPSTCATCWAGKPGRLPRQLDIAGAGREFAHQVGELAYWPPGNEIAIFYADDGQAIPQPGLVRLGTVDTGLEVIAAANDFEMTIQPLD